MRISLKHKFGTCPIKSLVRVVTYIGIWSIFRIAQTHWSENIRILLTNLMQNNLGLRGNGCYFKALIRKSEIYALMTYVRLKLAKGNLKNYAKSSFKSTF